MSVRITSGLRIIVSSIEKVCINNSIHLDLGYDVGCEFAGQVYSVKFPKRIE